MEFSLRKLQTAKEILKVYWKLNSLNHISMEQRLSKKTLPIQVLKIYFLSDRTTQQVLNGAMPDRHRFALQIHFKIISKIIAILNRFIMTVS